VIAKTQATNVQRYGNICSLRADEIQAKIKADLTMCGVNNIAQRPDVALRICQTMLERYGAEKAWASPIVRMKSEQTMLKRYGVSSSRDLLSFQINKRSSLAAARRHATMKRNDSFRKSKPEDHLYKILCEMFGENNVERQTVIPGTRWAIDFYVKSIDTYVQFDGVYWHGTGRSLDEVAEFKTKQDVVIHKKMLTDLEQNEWFKNNGRTLIRVTEPEQIKAALGM